MSSSSRPPPDEPLSAEPSHVAPAVGTSTAAPRPALPVPTRRDEVVDVLHGVEVQDPYRWLEETDAPEVVAWTDAQNRNADARLRAFPGRERLEARIEQLLRIGTVEPPFSVSRRGAPSRYFFRRQLPEHDQPVLYVRDGASGTDRALLDPNVLSPDRTTSLDWWAPSWDGKYVAFGLSEGGDEESTLYVLDVETGKRLPDTEVIRRARYASVAWLPDSSGFYYSRYPEKGSVPPGEELYHRRIYEHVLGRSPDRDTVVFGEGRALTDTPFVDISPDGRWVVFSVHMGWSRLEAYLLDRRGGGGVVPLAVPVEDAVYDVTPLPDRLLVRTNEGAPTYRLFRVDPERPARDQWEEVIPAHARDVLSHVAAVGDEIFATYRTDARSSVRRFDRDGSAKGELPLPTLGTVPGVIGAWNGREAFFYFTSFTIPSQVWRFDQQTEEVELWAEVKAPVDPATFDVHQLRARSRDGTLVPMFVVHRKGLVRDGTAPTLLSGYGGFNISLMPQWLGGRYVLLEHGGVSVTATLRGGGEYGEGWHRAGMLESKQNVFDDFIAVAEHLVRERYTSPEKLAITGASNGGLLVGAAITQRPDLFRAAVSQVPLLDMIRYHHFRIAKLWISEYGSAVDPAQFEWLYAYSPYHRVRPNTRYPAVLLSTAEGDSRVDPLHARKMAAALQFASTSGLPVLLRTERNAGHGAGKPVSKTIDELGDTYSFLFSELGIAVQP